MKKVALLLFIGALSITLVWMIWLANRPTAIERAVLSEAEAGAFPLEGDYTTTDTSNAGLKMRRHSTGKTSSSGGWD